MSKYRRGFIYIVQAGSMGEEGVEYQNVAAYSYPQSANRAIKAAKREDPYVHQYDRVERITLNPQGAKK